MKIQTRAEKHYIMIKLIKSGRSLNEANAMMKAASAGLFPINAQSGDLQDLQSLEGGLHRIRQTRNDAKQLMKIKFAPRKLNAPREEVLAKWATGYKGKVPLNWKRDGNLIRRGRPNKPKPGSSRKVIRQTRVIGAKKVLKDFRALVNTLQAFQKKHGKGNTRGLQKAYRSIRSQVSAK